MGPWRQLARWKHRLARGSIPPAYDQAAARVTDARPRISLAFAGAAYGWPYYCGVAWFVQKHRLLREDARFYCCSAGNVGGLYLAAGVDCEKDGLELCMDVNESHNHPLFGTWLRPQVARAAWFDGFGQLVPEDAHLRASGRLHVLITQLFPRLRRRIVSQFGSKRALLSAMAASMSIPGHGVHLAYRDDEHLADVGYCLDGGLLGTLHDDERDGWETVRISALPTVDTPLLKKIHIGPRPGLGFRDLFTIRSRAERRALHARGYEDAARFFEARLAASARDLDETWDSEDAEGALSDATSREAPSPRASAATRSS